MNQNIRGKRRFEFTCKSCTRRSPNYGQFVKGQTIIIIDVEEAQGKLNWFRSGGFSEKELQPLQAEPKPQHKPEPEIDPDKLHPIEDIFKEGLEPELDEKFLPILKDNGIITVEAVVELKEEGLLSIHGIGAATAPKILEACHNYGNKLAEENNA